MFKIFTNTRYALMQCYVQQHICLFVVFIVNHSLNCTLKSFKKSFKPDVQTCFEVFPKAQSLVLFFLLFFLDKVDTKSKVPLLVVESVHSKPIKEMVVAENEQVQKLVTECLRIHGKWHGDELEQALVSHTTILLTIATIHAIAGA